MTNNRPQLNEFGQLNIMFGSTFAHIHNKFHENDKVLQINTQQTAKQIGVIVYVVPKVWKKNEKASEK